MFLLAASEFYESDLANKLRDIEQDHSHVASFKANLLAKG
jgi:hypothetical protein